MHTFHIAETAGGSPASIRCAAGIPGRFETRSMRENSLKSRFRLLFASKPRMTWPMIFVICETGGKFDVSLHDEQDQHAPRSSSRAAPCSTHAAHAHSPGHRLRRPYRPHRGGGRARNLRRNDVAAGHRGCLPAEGGDGEDGGDSTKDGEHRGLAGGRGCSAVGVLDVEGSVRGRMLLNVSFI